MDDIIERNAALLATADGSSMPHIDYIEQAKALREAGYAIVPRKAPMGAVAAFFRFKSSIENYEKMVEAAEKA